MADAVRPHVVKMAEGSGGRYEAVDLFTAPASGRMLLWIALDGAGYCLCHVDTDRKQHPRRRAMRCVGLVGHRPRRWLGLLAEVVRAARETFRCDLMEALHQPMHTRLLTTGGWAIWHVLSEKRL